MSCNLACPASDILHVNDFQYIHYCVTLRSFWLSLLGMLDQIAINQMANERANFIPTVLQAKMSKVRLSKKSMKNNLLIDTSSKYFLYDGRCKLPQSSSIKALILISSVEASCSCSRYLPRSLLQTIAWEPGFHLMI